MIHDLTANSDFERPIWVGLNLNRIVVSMSSHERDSDLSEPYEEVVLTGSAEDRNLKRYILDYDDQKNMCDRCGAPIRIRPWDYGKYGGLCPKCTKDLEEYVSRKRYGNMRLSSESDVRRMVYKPWNMDEFEIVRETDYVLLWD